jgi:hypothetical protein
MSKHTYAYYEVYNHTDQLGISSYALPFCEFTFLLDLDSIEDEGLLSNREILWDYGDGTQTYGLTGSHAYTEPGAYQVTCYLYDNQGEAYLNTYSRELQVINFIPDGISLSASTSSIQLTAGKIRNPFLVSRTNSYQTHKETNTYTIVPFASGSTVSTNFFDSASANLYGHLEKYSAFYTEQELSDGTLEYVEIPEIITESTDLYCKLTEGEVIMTASDDIGSFFCGTSGSSLVYFKDDEPSYDAPVYLFFGFKSDVFNVNTSSIGLSCTIANNLDLDHITITSNGIDGEGATLSTFNLFNNKFQGQNIHFILRTKDSENFTIKNVYYTLTGVSLLKSVSASTGSYISEHTGFEAVITEGSATTGYLKGYVTALTAANMAYLSAVATVRDVSNTALLETAVESDIFKLYGLEDKSFVQNNRLYTESKVPTVAKQNEDIDMLDRYKDLRFQDLFQGKINLFDNFLGSIVGTISSNQNSIGKKIYERISNFVDNNSNIDTCDIAQLLSILQSVGEPNVSFEKVNFNYPSSFKRLVDLLSIKHSKLFGTTNTFDMDVYNYGNSLQGKNLGNKINNTLTYTITAGSDLIALERFSGTFKKVDTWTPLSASSLSAYTTLSSSNAQYPLSAYDDDWGWYFILNDNYTFTDLDKYYTLFEFIPTSNPMKVESIINFDDPNTTLMQSESSYSTWVEDNGTIDAMIAHQLSLGLGLISE